MENDRIELETEWRERVKYHPPQTKKRVADHETVNALAEVHGVELIRILPECRELHIALRRLEEARMWANAGLAIHNNAAEGRKDGED